MQIYTHPKGLNTYILLNGISVPQEIDLGNNVALLPADTSHLDFKTAISTISRSNDAAVVLAFIPIISAQFKISANNEDELAVTAWNSSWDALLLSAIFHTEVGFNLQSDTESSAINGNSILHATNYFMHGVTNSKSHTVSTQEISWISSNFSRGRMLLDNENFKTAVHCLASYRWHSMPRIQLAILWAGIEGIFGVSSEIRFRISLSIATFLYPDSREERKKTFESIKKLYNSRSAAVHGASLKKTDQKDVEDSAKILQKLVTRCIEIGSLPIESELFP